MERGILVYMGLGWAILFFGLLIFSNVSKYEGYTTGASVTQTENIVLSPTALAIIIPLLLSNIILIAIIIQKHFRKEKSL